MPQVITMVHSVMKGINFRASGILNDTLITGTRVIIFFVMLSHFKEERSPVFPFTDARY